MVETHNQHLAEMVLMQNIKELPHPRRVISELSALADYLVATPRWNIDNYVGSVSAGGGGGGERGEG